MKFRNDLAFTITYNTIMIKFYTNRTNVPSNFDNYYKSYSFLSDIKSTKNSLKHLDSNGEILAVCPPRKATFCFKLSF